MTSDDDEDGGSDKGGFVAMTDDDSGVRGRKEVAKKLTELRAAKKLNESMDDVGSEQAALYMKRRIAALEWVLGVRDKL